MSHRKDFADLRQHCDRAAIDDQYARTMHSRVRSLTALSGAASVIVALVGCSPALAAPAATQTPAPSTTPAGQALPSVPGYDLGEHPAVPLFQLPDLSLLDEGSASGFTVEMHDGMAKIPGVTVAPAHCDAGGQLITGQGAVSLYGDGSGEYTGADGTISNYGDGSGSFTLNGVTVQNYGDGSGSYTSGAVRIQNYGDGSGEYSDGTTTVHIYGDGSGEYTGADGTITNYGDGSGRYSGEGVTIENYGDGSGKYASAGLVIVNHGDGSGLVNGEDIEVEPLAQVAPLGAFPPLTALQPLASCGTLITFDAGILFDFDRADIRTDAEAALAVVAQALTGHRVADAVISGHTDAVGSDSYNRRLSEKRADAVVVALKAAGVATRLTAEGLGETRPVAPNEVDGQDNPAGRQLNRRVEIFIPASL